MGTYEARTPPVEKRAGPRAIGHPGGSRLTSSAGPVVAAPVLTMQRIELANQLQRSIGNQATAALLTDQAGPPALGFRDGSVPALAEAPAQASVQRRVTLDSRRGQRGLFELYATSDPPSEQLRHRIRRKLDWKIRRSQQHPIEITYLERFRDADKWVRRNLKNGDGWLWRAIDYRLRRAGGSRTTDRPPTPSEPPPDSLAGQLLRLPSGITVALAIPYAFGETPAEQRAVAATLPRERFSIHHFKAAWVGACNGPAYDPHVEPLWAAHRASHTKPAYRQLTYATASARQRGQIRQFLWDRERAAITNIVWRHARSLLAQRAVANESEFQLQAIEFARNQRAVAVPPDARHPVIGRHMTYRDHEDIPKAIKRVHTAVVATLIRAGRPASDANERGKVSNVAIFSHGTSRSIFGREPRAHTARVTAATRRLQGNLDDVANRSSAALTADVRVRLFACSTGGGEHDPDRGEGDFADQLRDLLVEAGHTGTIVVAHTTAGHTVANPDRRVFAGPGAEGGTDVLEGLSRFISEDFFAAEAARLGLTAPDGSIPDEVRKKLRQAMQHFIGANSWLFASLRQEAPTADDMRREFEEAWGSRVDRGSPLLRRADRALREALR